MRLMTNVSPRYASTDDDASHTAIPMEAAPPAIRVVDAAASFIQRSYTVRFLRTLYMLLTVCVSGVFASAFLVINMFYSIALIVLGPVFGAPWLGVDHELVILGMLLRMEFRRAEFYRTHAEALDKLAGNDTTTTTKLTKREIDALLQEIVQAQNDAVQEQIESGEKIIETKDTMSLSSVVVATVFFCAYCLYFWHDKGHSYGDVNSKYLDGLAIVLPMLLQEEMATGLSQVLLWYKWTPFSVDALIASTFGPIVRRHQFRSFESQINKQCLSVGVGAPDMTGFTAFITSLWTLFFLIQGYIVERLGKDGDARGELPRHAWLINTYWCILYYSGALILFCYLPFVCHISQLKKKDLESVAATCRTYIFLKRMGKTQSYLLRDKQQQEQDILLPSPYDEDAYYMARHLRYQTLMKMTADDAISFALYVVALSTYNFERTNDEPNALPNMQPTTSDRLTLSPLVKKNNPSFWARRIGDHHNATDAFPAFLLRLPKLDGTYVDSTEDHMTLFSMPVMDTYTTHHVTETITLEDVLIERNISNPNEIFNCSIVQNKKIYIAPKCNHLVCVGLEVKLMKKYTVSIFIMADQSADDAASFGLGPVYVAVCETPSVVRLRPTVDSPDTVEFKEVVDEHQLRAFASCTFKFDDKHAQLKFACKDTDETDAGAADEPAL
ncbi:Aste57867_15702 [Aphanomyces stellatus]|uniref:Aste57867_15702 protein n=1 Tax=Aphanomyces stellatus TaxID=120398 RepID=A0A485L4M0_9STRA|nr:hypothetical protein As57867_015646 [Aphanomyces stellatus]VFT92494.1 Aste57867_15702 [Aphanomyces stellatus]